jgi:hypothetical protein
MKTSRKQISEDDVSGEAWYQQGVTALERSREQRVFEAKLQKKLQHTAIYEPSFWGGLAIMIGGTWLSYQNNNPLLQIIWMPFALIQICGALEDASIKRMKAMFEWIEYQKEKDKAQFNEA